MLWGDYNLETDRTLRWQGGQLRMFVLRRAHEWRVGLLRQDGPVHAEVAPYADPLPPDVTWQRWTVDPTAERLLFEPAMPTRPIVVRPEGPVNIPPNQTTSFFISVPVWVRVLVEHPAGGSNLQIADEPSVVLSNSWFGDQAQGLSCFALKSRARRDPAEIGSAPCRAVCPVEIHNASGAPLFFERLCLEVGCMSIYRGTDCLWTDAAVVSYRGEDVLSHVSYHSGPPMAAPTAQRIAEPRKPAERSMFAKTFASLRTFANG